MICENIRWQIELNESLKDVDTNSVKFPNGWETRKLFVTSTIAVQGADTVYWKYGDVQLNRSNCDIIFGVCCIQNGSGIQPYPATINSIGNWYSALSSITGGACAFMAVGFGKF